MGEGDPELGSSLMEMALFTLSKQETPPKALVFMNGGVRIPCRAGQCAEALQSLEEKGVQILVCGTCLNFYGLTDRILAGTVSNMYEILACLQSGAVISL